MAPLRPDLRPDRVWPGAWRAEVAGAIAVIGDVDAASGPLPAPRDPDRQDADDRRGEGRRLFLRRRLLLRALVAQEMRVPADDVAIGYDAAGAPVVRAPVRAFPPSVFVSVAARGRLAGFAVARTPVGIDIEPLHDPGPLAAVLTPGERRGLAGLSEADRTTQILKYWTAKEAYLKRLGLGLRRDPAAIEVVASAEGGFLVRDGDMATGQGGWRAVEMCGTSLVTAVFRAADDAVAAPGL